MQASIINVLAILLYLGTRVSGRAIVGSEKVGISAMSNIRRSILESVDNPDDPYQDKGLQSVMKRSEFNNKMDLSEKFDGLETDLRRAIDDKENLGVPKTYDGLHSIQERNALSKDKNVYM